MSVYDMAVSHSLDNARMLCDRICNGIRTDTQECGSHFVCKIVPLCGLFATQPLYLSV